MKKTIFPLALFLFFIFSIPSKTSAAPEGNSKQDQTVPGEIIVKYKIERINLGKKTGRTLAGALEGNPHLEKKDEIRNLNLYVLVSDQNITDVIASLEQDPGVEYAQPNYRKFLLATPNDPQYAKQWALRNIGQAINGASGTSGADIDAAAGWDKEDPLQANIIVADIDTGTSLSNTDTADNLWDGSACVDENGVAIAGGCPHHGWNYADNTNDPQDFEGHGSFTSGIMAAKTKRRKPIG